MSVTNPESAQQALSKLKDRDRLGSTGSLDDLNAAEMRDHLETAPDPDAVTLTVAGETMHCDTMGVGQRVRPQKKALKAQERGDNALMLEANLDMIDALVAVSPDGYGQAYWDSLGDAELRDAFKTVAEESAGGNA